MGIWLLLLALLNPVVAGPGLPATGSSTQAVEVYELARPAPAPPSIKARSAIVLDLDTGGGLYQLDPPRPPAPARPLKGATPLVALEPPPPRPGPVSSPAGPHPPPGFRPGGGRA